MKRWNSNAEQSRNFSSWKTDDQCFLQPQWELLYTQHLSENLTLIIQSPCDLAVCEQLWNRFGSLALHGPKQGETKQCLSTMRLLLITQYRCSVAVVSKKKPKRLNTWCAQSSTSHLTHHLLSCTAMPKLAIVFIVISLLFVHCLNLPEGFPH